MIGVGRRQDHLRRNVAFSVSAIGASFIAGFRRHPNGIIDDALFEVSSHIAALREPAAAISAGVRLGAGVVVEVGLQVMLLGESFRAQGALVGFQAGVKSSV